jgi:very-short-patch-repair endonuclease
MAVPRAKRLRVNMTDAERKLWWALRSRSIGPKFRRQVPLGPYVVDFVCFESKLVVEVDGSQHMGSATDIVRDRYFSDRGYRILRFWNNDVLRDLEGVLTLIREQHPSPGSPPCGSPPSPSRGEGNRACGRG